MAAKILSEPEFPEGDLWVFGYGSLIWKPGFAFLEQKPARLIGEHRSLCIYSMVHRGTPEKPGLVLGLDRGGACQGVAFRVAATERKTTVAYLREREQVTSVYIEAWRNVTLERPDGARVRGRARRGGHGASNWCHCSEGSRGRCPRGADLLPRATVPLPRVRATPAAEEDGLAAE